MTLSDNRSVDETTSVSPPRLPPVDERHDQPDQCKAGANEDLRGVVMSGDVNDPSDDQDHAHHNGHPREYVPEEVPSYGSEATRRSGRFVLVCHPTSILLLDGVRRTIIQRTCVGAAITSGLNGYSSPRRYRFPATM